MGQSPGALKEWLGHDFYDRGAFLTSADGETVIFAKGGEVTQVNQFINTEAPVFYLKDFFENTYLAFVPESFIRVSKATVIHYLKEVSDSHTPFRPSGNDDDLYEKDFQLLKSSFKNGLEKVVLVSRETYASFEGAVTIKHLLRRAFEFGTGTPYGFWNSNYGVLGSTPELLYDVQDGVLRTFALAGTAMAGEEKELLESKKDRHEHDLVIKDISEKLQNFAIDLIKHETDIHPYKTIVHLKTDIEARVKTNVNYTDLTSTMSPTAALGGYPKNLSLKFLKGTNYASKYPKRFFGSCFGLISKDTREFVVSIRNVQWEDAHLFIESGGGIVQESEFEKEIAEIHLKRNTIRKNYL